MKIEAVICDWAGTLIDFGSLAPMGAFVRLFEHHGVEVSIEQARVPMGLPKIDHIRAMGRMPEIAQGWRDAHSGREFTDTDAQMLLREFEPMSAAAAWERREFVPGWMETYEWLSKHNIKVATTTGYTRRIMTPILEDASKRGFMPSLTICCDDVERSRPDPMGIYACCRAMSVVAGRHVLKVDDTAPGIAEGVNAGCTTVGVAASGNTLGWDIEQWRVCDATIREAALTQATRQLQIAGADHVIASVADLPLIIQQLESS